MSSANFVEEDDYTEYGEESVSIVQKKVAVPSMATTNGAFDSMGDGDNSTS